jgi:hypothetical protein
MTRHTHREDKVAKKPTSDTEIDLLRTLVIIQLGLAGVPQRKIRQIVGGDLNKVTNVLRHLPKAPKKGA